MVQLTSYARAMILPLVVTMAVTTAAAQTTGAATLVGTVTDSSSASVPGAKVTVVNTRTLFHSETVTGTEGNYYVPYLNPGVYRITVEASGFRSYLRDGFDIRSGETPRLDVSLEVGSVSEAVTVTAAAPLLNTETAASSQILGTKTLLDLQVGQKQFQRILYYFPGVISSSGAHILGQSTRSIGYSLDGITAKIPGLGGGVDITETVQTSLDAVEEMKVTTSGMTAEMGHSSGGAVAMVFKSGTNQLHGSFEERFYDKLMLHRHYLEQFDRTDEFRINHPGGHLSGPLYLPKLYNGKNRTFFLFGYQDQYAKAGEVGIKKTVPTEVMYNGDFSFGGQGLPIYNPFTTRETAPGRWTRDPFPDNRIPKSLFDPVAVNFLERNPFTKPNDPGIMTRTGPVQNLISEDPKRTRRARWDAKIDHQFSSNHKIFGRYSRARHRQTLRKSEINWLLIDPNQQPFPIDQTNIVLSDTLVLSSKRFNEIRLGLNRRAYTQESLSYGQDWAKQLGMPNVSPLTFPYFNIGYGLSELGTYYQTGEDITFQDNFTQILGRHTIKAGYELMRTRFNASVETQPSGSYSFGGTNMPFTPNTGNGFASFLLGTVSSATFTQDFATWLPRWLQHSLYVQDEWKPVRGLTLNLGLRWSYESPFQTKYGQQSQFDPAALDPLTGKPGAITHPKGRLGQRDWNNFQPRLGLTWSFRPKWVFRSSFAVMMEDLGIRNIGQNFQEYVGTVNVQAPPGDPRHMFRLSEGPPQILYPAQSDGTFPFVGANYGARGAEWYDPNLRVPYILSWSGGFQYEVARNWLVELMYQATAGLGLVQSWNINAIPLDISRDPVVLNQIYQAQQNYKPYTHFGAITHTSNYGHNTHHSGTARVEKRFSSGIHVLTFYTWSKTLDEGTGGITYYNRSLEKGRSSYDVRHHFVHTMTYELPLGKGRRWMRQGFLTHPLGGWNIIWAQTLESGLPTTVSFGGSPNRYLAGGLRPNALTPIEQAVVQDWDIGPNRFPTAAQNPYLRFDAFAYPAAFTPGTLGRNIYESPGLSWTQITIIKEWLFGERTKFSLRGDFSNLPFKQPQFSPPNSTYNANSPLTFGRFTSVRGSLVNVGSGQPCISLGIRLQF